MCLATASAPSRSVSQARAVRAFSIVSAVVKVLLRAGGGGGGGGGRASKVGEATGGCAVHEHNLQEGPISAGPWLQRCTLRQRHYIAIMAEG